MQLKHPAPFARGYEAIVDRSGPNADMLMDFGILTLGPKDSWDAGSADEKALLLMSGAIEFSWKDEGGSERRAFVSRRNLFDEAPTVLHLPSGTDARIVAGTESAELSISRTSNIHYFPPHLYEASECRSEERGKGTMRETSTRIVRTVFDDSNAKLSNLVLGEVIGVPGRWSSYPPHHHPQPEIYHYRFLPEHGFGLTAIGDETYQLRERDTVLIREGQIHPHVTAPGYAMWYLWVIRHLEGRRYVTPIFVPEHLWVTERGADIWCLPSER
jgi:5-deoxy-glucuronate isomerase